MTMVGEYEGFLLSEKEMKEMKEKDRIEGERRKKESDERWRRTQEYIDSDEYHIESVKRARRFFGWSEEEINSTPIPPRSD